MGSFEIFATGSGGVATGVDGKTVWMGGGCVAAGMRAGGGGVGCCFNAAEPHVGAVGAGAVVFATGGVLAGGENVAGIAAIARGFTNGMTFSDAGFGLLTGAREPLGGGAIRRAITCAESAVVRSSLSNG